MVDVTFTPKSDGQYLTQRVISSLAANVSENEANVEAGVLIAASGTNTKILKIPGELDALELQVRKHAGTGTAKMQMFNSVDDITYEATPTNEYNIDDPPQIFKFDALECSRYVKLVFTETGGANSITLSVKARVQL